MKAWGLAVAALACLVGVWLGVTGPETTPVDPAPFLDAQGGGPR
jgi:hypothetical protein